MAPKNSYKWQFVPRFRRNAFGWRSDLPIRRIREALDLAEHSPCDPRTLTRAARDMAESNPDFAIGAGRAALKWMLLGYGYDISRFDVYDACRWTLQAAKKIDRVKETVADIYEMCHIKISGHVDSMVAAAILEELERYMS